MEEYAVPPAPLCDGNNPLTIGQALAAVNNTKAPGESDSEQQSVHESGDDDLEGMCDGPARPLAKRQRLHPPVAPPAEPAAAPAHAVFTPAPPLADERPPPHCLPPQNTVPPGTVPPGMAAAPDMAAPPLDPATDVGEGAVEDQVFAPGTTAPPPSLVPAPPADAPSTAAEPADAPSAVPRL